jgi:hypothetical protein
MIAPMTCLDSDTSVSTMSKVLSEPFNRVPILLTEYQDNCLRILALKYFLKFALHMTYEISTLEVLCFQIVSSFVNIIPFYLSHQSSFDTYLNLYDDNRAYIRRFFEFSDQMYGELQNTGQLPNDH